MRITIACRSTGRGAETRIMYPEGAIVSDVSGTGHHWHESVDVEAGTKVFVKDITNSRKHECYWLIAGSDEQHSCVVDGNCELCNPSESDRSLADWPTLEEELA